ncbi:MAG: ferrous iron transport protein B [Candidatus Gastranaerophilales bacterium]|nr:ferrous iron transport protein B [Candidatus Gastranaerophilales bacterium]
MEISSCNYCSKKCLKNKNELNIAIIGNPNVGKTLIYNSLTKIYCDVSNFPGTTIAVKKCKIGCNTLIDTPGVYSISDYTDDEVLTRKIFQNADAVINVVSALTLERDLFLTLQIADLGKPFILVVNQTDEAIKQGININFKKLEDILGIRVIEASAIKKIGIPQIMCFINEQNFKESTYKTPIIYKEKKDNNFIYNVESQNPIDKEFREKIYIERQSAVENIVSQINIDEKEFDFSKSLGNFLLSPIGGFIIAAVVLYALYLIIGVFVAGVLVDNFSDFIDKTYVGWITQIINGTGFSPFIKEFLVGENGILIMTVLMIFGILLPLVCGFFLFMAILEDTGYLPRLAVLLDTTLSKIGLNGKAVIPVLLGFGCGTMGIIATKMLDSKKEKSIVITLLALAVPCSPQIGAIIALIASTGMFYVWVLYIAIVFAAMVAISTILNKLTRGKATDLIIDIPPMRMPNIKNVYNKLVFKTKDFIFEAVPLFIIGTGIISILQAMGALAKLQKLLEPITINWLNLPVDFTNVLIAGIIRKDFGVTMVLDFAEKLSPLQILISCLVATFFVPCIMAMIVIFKEMGSKKALLIWLSSFTFAIVAGTILTRILDLIM